MEFTLPEKTLLVSLLDQALKDAHSAVHHSSSFESRENLKSQLVLLRNLLAKVQGLQALSA